MPVTVARLASGVASIAAGLDHTCALTRAGRVKCWGFNIYGQLGDGTTTNRRTPVDVSGLPSVVAGIAAGADHTCALTGAGGVKCWGENDSGQLGDGTATDRHVPVDVFGLASGVESIAAGGVHTCALTSAGAVKCWGMNLRGELGDGTTTQRNAPVDVSGLESGVAAIAAGGDDVARGEEDDNGHTCALTGAGGVKCWGANFVGQLGDGTTTERHTPVSVSGLASGVVAIAAGVDHTCALTTGGAVECWGGLTGDGTLKTRLTPVAVSGLASGVVAIAAGEFHSCALTSLGRVKCWGDNSFGELGDGTAVSSLTPVGVIGFGGSLKCAVPYTLGIRLARANSVITRAHCRVGTVTRVASRKRKNTVVGQSPRPFKRLKKGARVNLKVSRGH